MLVLVLVLQLSPDNVSQEKGAKSEMAEYLRRKE